MAVGAVTAMTFAGQGIPGAATAATNTVDNPTKASASVLSLQAGVVQLGAVASSQATPTTNPGPNQSRLNGSVNGAEVNVNDVLIPISDFVDFGQAGALGSESTATSAWDTHAVSGAVSSDGGITLDRAPGDYGSASIDLLSLFKKAGISGLSNLLVDEATLELGLGGAELTTQNGVFTDPDGVGGAGRYVAGDIDLFVHSPATDTMAASTYDGIGQMDDAAEKAVNDMLDLSALSAGFPSGTVVTADVTSEMQERVFARLLEQPITTKNHALSVDFSTGRITLHLDQLMHGQQTIDGPVFPPQEVRPGDPNGINSQHPNTELIDDELYPMVAETVHELMEEVSSIALGAVEDSLDAITVDFTATSTPAPGDTAVGTWTANLGSGDIGPSSCTSTGPQSAALCDGFQGVLDGANPAVRDALAPAREFLVGNEGQEMFRLAIHDLKTAAMTIPARKLLEPFIEAVAKVVSVQVNHQRKGFCTSPAGEQLIDQLSVSAVSVGLLRQVNGAALNFGNASSQVDNCGPTAEATLVETSSGLNRAVDAGYSWADPETNPGPNEGGLNAGAFGLRPIDLGTHSLPLEDFLEYGDGGALQSESTATSPYDARAIAGIGQNDGSIDLDDGDGGYAPAEIDLLKLMGISGEPGLTDLLVDEALLRIGVGGSEVEAVDGNILDPDGVGGPGRYRVGEASVIMHSPKVDEMSSQLYDAVGMFDDVAEEQTNKLLDLTKLTEALPTGTVVTAQVTSEMQEKIFAAILDQEITTKNNVLSINFATGDFTLHLDQLMHGEEVVDGPVLAPHTNRPGDLTGINAQQPNTEIVDDELYPMVAETVHDLMEEVYTIAFRELEGALGSITVDFTAKTAPGGGNSATVTWSANLLGQTVQAPTCTPTGLLGGVLCVTLTSVVNVAAPVVNGLMVPVRDFLISDAGHEIFALAVDDLKTGAITVPARQVLEPFIETFARVFSVQVNRQSPGYCVADDGTRTLSSLRVSAVSVALGREHNVARLDFGNSTVRTSCYRP